MKKLSNWKKRLSALLCIAVLATSMPSIVFAAEADSARSEAPSEQTVQVEVTTDQEMTDVDVETTDAQVEVADADISVEPTAAQKEADDAQAKSTDVQVETAAAQDEPATVQVETAVEDVPILDAEAPAIESDSVDSSVDNDELFEEYVNQLFFGASSSAPSQKKLRASSARTNLSEYEQIVYDTLKEGAAALASGDRSSSIFEIPIADLGGQMYTAEELGLTSILNYSGKLSDEAKAAIAEKSYVDVSAVVQALLADCPYELYWFDKTVGYSWGYPSISYAVTEAGPAGYKQGGYLTIYMAVAGEYSDGSYTTVGGKDLRTGTDTSVTGAASSAAVNAQNIVSENAGLADYEKLTSYKDTICELTDYNRAAVDDNADYGNPWQLIWVFDENTETKVVCEGYSKAFQYLCDQSEFAADIECITVSGTMSGGTGAGGHMWNIVHMDDSRNYLVDVTNCDSGTVGYPDSLFLKGYAEKNAVEAEAETAGGTVTYTTSDYIFTASSKNISYVYDYDTVDLYAEDALILSANEYVPVAVYDDSQNYLVFASDRHGNTTGNDTQISTAMTGIKEEYPSVEYVSLIGDMVGSGGSNAPAYDCSIVYDEVHEVFPNLDTDHVSIVWGTHDAGVTDNNHYNMVYGASAGSSGLMHTDLNNDGSVAYYIYAIAYYDMNNASNAAAAAAAFTEWANSADVDKTAPIIVLCHMPLHYARKDNKGAAYWSNAFNQIATGETTQNTNDAFTSGKGIVRNIIYLHGHNHTTESNREYYVGAESQMNIQSDSSSLSTYIYYTYATAGYMQANNKNATLISINDSDITLTKYQNGTVSNAYSSGTFGNTDTSSAAHKIERAAAITPGITISPETLQLNVGDSETLTAVIDNTDDAKVTWTSSDNDVATVSDGIVRAVAEGTATITASITVNGNTYSDTCEVTVSCDHDWGEVIYTWSGDFKKVTATRTCTKDPSHVETETVDATYKVTKAATETEAGVGTWTSAEFANSAFAVQTKEVTIPPTGFEITYEWIKTDDGYSVKATAVPYDTTADTITETVTATYAVTTAPTCTEKGVGAWTSETFKSEKFDVQTKEVDIAAVGHDYKTEVTAPTCTEKGFTTHTCTRCGDSYEDSYVNALGHDWDTENITWTWSDDYSSATAAFTCKNDTTHKKTVDAEVTSKITAATCEADGKRVYTATAAFENKSYTDAQEVEIPATGHRWYEVTYTWADDFKEVTAKRTCANDASHVETETVEATYKVTKAATETEAGIGIWTSAEFTNSAFAVQTKEVTIPPTGFEVTYKWVKNDDGYEVTATAVPYNTTADTITETVSATYAVTTAPTCTEKGVGTWTSAAFENEKFGVQTKEVDIAAAGHAYAFTGFTWTGNITAGYTAAKLKLTCKNDTTHVKTLNAKISVKVTPATGAKSGTIVYTATAAFNGKTYTDSKTVCVEPILMKASGKNKKMKLAWKKLAQADGYFVYYNDCGHALKKAKTVSASTLKATFKKLRKNHYKAMIKAYKVINGKKVVISSSYETHITILSGKQANATRIKLKSLASLTLSKGKTAKIKAKVLTTKGKVLLYKGHSAKLRYASTNVAVASVNNKGKITAKSKGTCKIYVIAPNGIRKAVTVTVK